MGNSDWFDNSVSSQLCHQLVEKVEATVLGLQYVQVGVEWKHHYY